jgi:hypothetical protein
MHYFLFWHSMLQKFYKLMEPLVPWASSHVWYWLLSFGCKKNFFHQPQFDPNSSWVDFFEKVFIYVKERLFLKWCKDRKRFFPSHSIWSESISHSVSETVFATIKSLWFLSFGCKKQFFASASIWFEFILTWLLWEGIFICKWKIISEMI